jgi:AAA15 family ATPase/GTPase
MFASIRIQNYRGIRDLQINNLARVNVFGGDNNTGKTTVLEAVALIVGNVEVLGIRFGGKKEIEQETKGLFHQKNIVQSITISTSGENENGNRELTIEYPPLPPKTTFKVNGVHKQNFPTYFYPGSSYRLIHRAKSTFEGQMSYFQGIAATYEDIEVLELYNQAVATRKDDLAAEMLRNLEPNYKRLVYLPLGLYADINGKAEMLKLDWMGTGFVRVTEMMLALACCANGVLMIDEIETGLHHSHQQKLWQAVLLGAREFNVQVFATTHSQEMIRAAHQTFSQQQPYDLSYYRLNRADDGAISATHYYQEAMNGATEFNFEVRGE